MTKKNEYQNLRFDGADPLLDNGVYGVIIEDGGYQIRSSENKAVIRPFRVGKKYNANPLGIDVVPKHLISSHLFEVWGIELNDDAYAALGISPLDETAKSIEENVYPIQTEHSGHDDGTKSLLSRARSGMDNGGVEVYK